MDKEFMDYLEVVDKMIVILGLPIAYIQYVRTKRKEKQDREYGTYDALDEKYLAFQKLCLEHPKLDVFDIADTTPQTLSEEEKKQELILFTMLFSIFERAHLLYRREDSAIRQQQWSGWDSYISAYCRRKNFVKAWKISGTTFDTNFQAYMSRNIEAAAQNVTILDMN